MVASCLPVPPGGIEELLVPSWTVWVGWPWAPRWGTVGGRERRGMRGQAGIELLALAYSTP